MTGGRASTAVGLATSRDAVWLVQVGLVSGIAAAAAALAERSGAREGSLSEVATSRGGA